VRCVYAAILSRLRFNDLRCLAVAAARSHRRALDRLTRSRTVTNKTVKGINFFDTGDSAVLRTLQNPRVNIAGVRRGDLLPTLRVFSPTRLRRLLDLGAIKRVTGTHRYYLTKAGRAATAVAGRLTQAFVIPQTA